MRNTFEEQLELLKRELTDMGDMCRNAITLSIRSLREGDGECARETLAVDAEIDRCERDIEALCLRLILRQQPVAKDLRFISAAMKMITDMERIGDQAADIAEMVSVADLSVLNDDVNIADMETEVVKMVSESVEAFVKRDVALAAAVLQADDTVDALFVKIKRDLINFIICDSLSGEAALDILMIAKYLERIGDHATNIAEWVIFAVTGKHA